jgi:hypothetical protein
MGAAPAVTVAPAAVAAPRIPQGVRGRRTPTVAMDAMVVTGIRSGTVCVIGLKRSDAVAVVVVDAAAAVVEDAVAGAAVVVADGTTVHRPMVTTGHLFRTTPTLLIQRQLQGTCQVFPMPTRKRHPE